MDSVKLLLKSENTVELKPHLLTMWQIDCRLLIDSATMALCMINTTVGVHSLTAFIEIVKMPTKQTQLESIKHEEA